MINRALLAAASCALVLALSGCGGDDDAPSADAADQGGTGSAADTPPPDEEEPEPEADDRGDVLDGRDVCTLIDHATLGDITQTEIVTAEPDGTGTGCSFNSSEPGVTSGFLVVSTNAFGREDSFAQAEDRTQDDVSIPGADDGWVSRSESNGQPEVQACGVVGDVTACAYTTAYLNVTSSELEGMGTELAGLLVAAV